jgi:hypothetical protein
MASAILTFAAEVLNIRNRLKQCWFLLTYILTYIMIKNYALNQVHEK